MRMRMSKDNGVLIPPLQSNNHHTMKEDDNNDDDDDDRMRVRTRTIQGLPYRPGPKHYC